MDIVDILEKNKRKKKRNIQRQSVGNNSGSTSVQISALGTAEVTTYGAGIVAEKGVNAEETPGAAQLDTG